MDTKKKKINLIDIIILLAIIAVIASPFLRAYIKDLTFSEKNADEITFTVTVQNQSTYISRAISVGDTVYFENSKDKCGTVLSVIPQIYEGQTENCDLKITISALAKKHKSGIYINNDLFIANAMDLSLYTNKYTFFGRVSDLQITESN